MRRNELRKYLVAASVTLVFALAGQAYGQNQLEGLDLSEDKKEEPAKEEPRREEPELGAEKAEGSKKGIGPAVERDVTQDDRVKSVQRKLYMKRGRFELAPAIAINVNDAYYTKWGGALRAAFYPADTLAISVRFTLLDTVRTDDVRTAKRNLSSTIFYSVPYWTAMADVEWSPLYGKVAIFNSILHFDGYLAAGAGVAYTETSADTLDPSRSGVKPAFDLGIGLRFVTTDWLAVNVGLINTAYVDTPIGTTKSSLQNVMLVHAGVSIFIPFKSTFREAE
jgi:outer membrane beta-barrel protein